MRLVYARPILYVYTIADAYSVYIGTENSTKPYRTIVAHGDVAHNGGILREITIVPPLRAFTVYLLSKHVCEFLRL